MVYIREISDTSVFLKASGLDTRMWPTLSSLEIARVKESKKLTLPLIYLLVTMPIFQSKL